MEENQHKKSWWKRNWKWVVPTGGCLGLIFLIVVFAGSVIYGVTSLMADSDGYKTAMAAAKENQAVIELLGEPIEENGMAGGSVNTSNGFKSVALTIPIKGPKGEATIRVEGEGVGDNWTYQVMNVYVDSADTIINLLEQNTQDLDMIE